MTAKMYGHPPHPRWGGVTGGGGGAARERGNRLAAAFARLRRAAPSRPSAVLPHLVGEMGTRFHPDRAPLWAASFLNTFRGN